MTQDTAKRYAVGPGFESLKVHQGIDTFLFYMIHEKTLNLLFIGRTRQYHKKTGLEFLFQALFLLVNHKYDKYTIH